MIQRPSKVKYHDPMIIHDWLSARAQISPKKIAVTNPDGRLSYQQLNQLAEQYAARLLHSNRSKAAVYGRNSLVTVALIHALIKNQMTIVPLNLRLTQDELSFQLQNVDAGWLVYESTVQAAEILQHLPVDGFLKCRQGFELETIDVPKDEVRQPAASGEIDLDSSFAIVHTSGTSGKPKGAVLTYGNVFYSAMASAYRIGHLPDDKWLCVLPLYHVGGLSILIRAVLYGITVDLHPKFDVEAINHALTHNHITLVSLVPTMLHRLLEARKAPWNPKLRLVLLGGAAPSAGLVQRCIEENIPIASTYGLTEAASQVATALPQQVRHKPGSVGKPLMFTQIKIVDDEGQQQAPGEYGAILVKGPTVMQGYHNDTGATAKALHNAWLQTGDIGYLDDEGDLFLVQRRSDLIVSGGENIYPAEVEAVLRQHSAVQQVAVVGVEDAEWGQRVAAALIIAEGQSVTESELVSYARSQLAGYKIPRLIKFVDVLPVTGSGKVQRAAVRGLFTQSNPAS